MRSLAALQEGWLTSLSRKHRERERNGICVMAAGEGDPKEYWGSRAKLCARLRACCGRETMSDTRRSRLLSNDVGYHAVWGDRDYSVGSSDEAEKGNSVSFPFTSSRKVGEPVSLPVIHRDTYLYRHAPLLCGRPRLPPPLPPPTVLPCQFPVSPSWLSFRWTRRTSRPFGSRLSSTVRPSSNIIWNLTSPLRYPGINFTLCWICGYVLIKKKSKTPWIILAVIIVQWMLSTVHVSLGFTVSICSLRLTPSHHEPHLDPRSD
jgi:hypothetical protein